MGELFELEANIRIIRVIRFDSTSTKLYSTFELFVRFEYFLRMVFHPISNTPASDQSLLVLFNIRFEFEYLVIRFGSNSAKFKIFDSIRPRIKILVFASIRFDSKIWYSPVSTSLSVYHMVSLSMSSLHFLCIMAYRPSSR